MQQTPSRWMCRAPRHKSAKATDYCDGDQHEAPNRKHGNRVAPRGTDAVAKRPCSCVHEQATRYEYECNTYER